MKLRALLFVSLASLAFTQAGCFGLLAQKPADNIGGDWTSPLDADLALAAPS